MHSRLSADDRAHSPGAGSTLQSSRAEPPAAGPVAELGRALEILARRLREAVAVRRESAPGSDGYRRADERVAYLNELYVRLQRRMEVPVELWLLDGQADRSTAVRVRAKAGTSNGV